MNDKELLGTKSGVFLSLIDADRKLPMPGVPGGSVAYEISTDLRSERIDCVTLTTDEATQVAIQILMNEFERRGIPAASAPLRTCARLLHVDLEKEA